ncbi:adenosylcobinamide-phosphate synthase CbiB [Pseudodesulfovibrio portus]|uniref:Cobalamin biosynthesis protein CobD n=1 Tax=Pseudodesulfovibrio portus TaxID=231439 RepID=A0ABN6RPI0_9BACT|nr:adenosylcobinamide-phosphate synthase CbiB [Pseudodesulfovibrio portus]BDQ32727.1 cobalamin biosynthesis protein CobD [Pseudodesulfovibrio portus]
MDSFITIIIIPVIAVALDSVFGDPKSLPHPVRFIGKLLELYEGSARRVRIPLRAAGWVAVFLFAVSAWGAVAYLTAIPYLGVVIGVYFAYAGLALGCLMKDARTVARLLDYGSMAEARRELAMLVSRDTGTLDEAGLRRTLAETVSENLNDGFVAPLFYLSLFGPGGMWAYKTVSTMDSMWGYRTERYRDLGRGAAKTDDLLAWIPARITARIMLFAGRRLGLDHAAAKANYKGDALKMESPNAGWPMAAAAWLAGGQMGGPTVYFGKIKDKPLLGPTGQDWDKGKIRTLIRLCGATGNWAAWMLIPSLGLVRWIF